MGVTWDNYLGFFHEPIYWATFVRTALYSVVVTLIVLTGLCMSPGFDAALHISGWFGGRQTARSLHFIAAAGFALFIVVHLVMVVLAGPFNEVRSMITGKYRLPKEKEVQS